MSEVTKNDKVEMLIGAAIASASYYDMCRGDEGDAFNEKLNTELQTHLLLVAGMIAEEYLLEDGDVSEFLAIQADASFKLCERRVESKQSDGKGFRVKGATPGGAFHFDDIADAIGEEAAYNLKKFLEDNA